MRVAASSTLKIAEILVSFVRLIARSEVSDVIHTPKTELHSIMLNTSI